MRNTAGAAAFVLAAALGTVVVVVSIGAAWGATELSGKAGQAYTGIVGAMVGAVAVYIGGRGRNGR